MKISFPFLEKSLYSLYPPERIYLTAQQMAIAKIVLAIFSALSAIYLCLKLDSLRQRVTVIDADGNSYSIQIQNVTGNFKVIFNGYFASQAIAEGEFIDGQLNGRGKIIFPYGAVAEEDGEFLNGWLVEGKLTYRNGKVEEGEFNQGILDGEGKRTYPDGKVEKGYFENGKYTNSVS